MYGLDILWLSKKSKKVTVKEAKGCDLIVCRAYPYTIPKNILSIPKRGCINVHTSLLPYYRGRHPIVWAMIMGERQVGVTVHYMDEGIDTGPIIVQARIEVGINDTYATILDRANLIGEFLLRQAIGIISEDPHIETYEQKSGFYMPRRIPKDSEIKFLSERRIKQLIHFVKALSDPMPNAYKGSIRIKDIIVEEISSTR